VYSEIIHQSNHATISINREIKIIYIEWRGFCPGNEFRKITNFLLNYMPEINIYKIINDISIQNVIPTPDLMYAITKTIEFVRIYGIIKIAFVINDKSIWYISVWFFNKKISDKLEMKINRFFRCANEAEKWLNM